MNEPHKITFGCADEQGLKDLLGSIPTVDGVIQFPMVDGRTGEPLSERDQELVESLNATPLMKEWEQRKAAQNEARDCTRWPGLGRIITIRFPPSDSLSNTAGSYRITRATQPSASDVSIKITRP
jgi:hypothetical protein